MNKQDTQQIFALANKPLPAETDLQMRERLDSVCIAADIINANKGAAIKAETLAGLLRWQAKQLNGEWDTEAVSETYAWWKARGVVPLY